MQDRLGYHHQYQAFSFHHIFTALLRASTSHFSPDSDPETNDDFPTSFLIQMTCSNLTVAKINSILGPRLSLISGAGWVSRGIVAGAEWLKSQISGGTTHLSHTKPVTEPINFSANTTACTKHVVGFTRTVTKVIQQATRMIGGIATHFGNKVGKVTRIQHALTGEMPEGAQAYVAQGIMTFNVVIYSIDYSRKTVLSTVYLTCLVRKMDEKLMVPQEGNADKNILYEGFRGSSATTMVTHFRGPQASQQANKEMKPFKKFHWSTLMHVV